MLCPACRKPYYFIDPVQKGFSRCLRCQHAEKFEYPAYNDYHKNLYEAETYVRTKKTDPQMKFILNKINLKSSDTVLDIGCGVGDYTKAIYLINKNVSGLDRDVAAAQKKYPGINFLAHDCDQSIPYADDYADAIISINLIEHLVNYRSFLSECWRVLKPGGSIVLTTANLEFMLHDYFFDKTHVHEWTLEQFKNIIQPYFEIVLAGKSSSMFKYYPFNMVLTKILKPDILLIGKKHE